MMPSTSTMSGKGRGRPPGGPSKPKSAPSIIEALADKDMFKGMFDAPSWDAWKAFLEALWALPMSEAHLDLYRRHTAAASLLRGLRAMLSSSSAAAAANPASWR